MNKLTAKTNTDTIKPRYGINTAVIIVGISLLTLIVYNLSKTAKTHSTSENHNPPKTSQYAVLSTTNAILKEYRVNEGEFVNKSSDIAILIDSHFEEQLQNAHIKVSQARLTLQEKRIENISNARKPDQYTSNTSLQTRFKAKQTKNDIIRQKKTIRNLTATLAIFNAKFTELNSQPFQQKGNQDAIRSVKIDITKFESKLDVENVALKQLQSALEIQSAQVNIATQTKDIITASNRSIVIATNNLRYEENILKEIQQKKPQFSTTISVPFSGLITETRIPEGSYVREGEPILIMTKQD